MDFETWLNKNSSTKNYAHFDKPVALSSVIESIKKPEYISKHAFMPFIHYPLIFKKYTSTHERKKKIRHLYMSSHFDRCIYQYYSYLLNEQYNHKIRAIGLNDSVIAYRTDLYKQTNINFAKSAFDFIKQQNKCFIIVGDFKDFFDSLDHKYLKEKLCNLFNIKSLPLDFYKVYRSITKYSSVNLNDLLDLFQLNGVRSSNRRLKKLLNIQTIREHKELIKVNKNNYGIPQGSAISAVLSNIYMLDFDKQIKDFMKAYNGKYMRYSDDTIFIIPNMTSDDFNEMHSKIQSIVCSVPNLILQAEKTKIYDYCEGNLQNKDSLLNGKMNDKNVIDYLGFSFDGKKVSIRDKTISKYYYRAYKKVKTIVNINKDNTNKKVSCENLYRLYTIKGTKKQGQNNGNFLSYAKRCSKVFGKQENVCKVLNNHLGKIKKRLNK